MSSCNSCVSGLSSCRALPVGPQLGPFRQSSSRPVEELRMKERKSRPPGLTVTGETARAGDPVRVNGELQQTNEEQEEGGEDLRAPLELKLKFLRALKNKDFQLADKLCRMILVFEPDNAEAPEFLPLIQMKLLEGRDEEDEEDDDSESDARSSSTSSCSASSSSSSSSDEQDDDDDENK